MKNRIISSVFFGMTIIYMSGCASLTGMNKSSNLVQCTSMVSNASYTGPYKGVDNNLDSTDLSRDIYCANYFKKNKYPNGFVTIYGSSRINEKNSLPETDAAKANTKIYQETMSFAEKWTATGYGKRYPIMTGAGPGIMEAGSRGATQAGGPSIGYTTYYDPYPRGDAIDAFWKYNGQQITSDGLIFSSVGIREYMMILHSAAIVIAPGGTGTEWETFQILESIKSNQLKKVPIYLVGNKEAHWESFYRRLDDMVRRGTIKKDEVFSHFIHVDSMNDLFGLLEHDLIKQY